MDLLWAKKTAKLIKLQNRSSIARSRTSYGSSDCPPELCSLSQYSPQEEENAEKWDYEKKNTGWHEKEEKILTLEAQQWKFMKSLLMPPAMGGMQYGQKALQEGGKENSKTSNACLGFMCQ